MSLVPTFFLKFAQLSLSSDQGFVPGPILWGPLSEMYGRKSSILTPMFVFLCFSVATATAKDLETIFITRMSLSIIL